MRHQTIIGTLESGETEVIMHGPDLPAQDRALAKLVDEQGVKSERKHYVLIEVITNDHVKRRIAFPARPEKIAERAKADAARVQAEEAERAAAKKAADEKADKEAAEKRAKLDKANLAARAAILGTDAPATGGASPAKTA